MSMDLLLSNRFSVDSSKKLGSNLLVILYILLCTLELHVLGVCCSHGT